MRPARPIAVAESARETAPGLARPADASAADDVLARLQAMLDERQDTAELSAALTLTRRTARWRGIAAIVGTVAGLAYAAFDAAHDRFAGEAQREEAAVVERVDAVEREVGELGDKVDAMAEAVDALAGALASEPAEPPTPARPPKRPRR